MSTHINEESLTLNDLVSDKLESFDPHEEMRQGIKDFLSKFYTWDDDLGEFDDTPKDGYRPYEIKAEYEDDCADMFFVNIFSIRVSLPTDEDAKELAAILDGEVVDGLDNDCPVFRITYRNEIYIKANDQQEAERIFRDMGPAKLSRDSDFVEIVSTERQD